MFKLLIALFLFVAVQGQVGSYIDRPDLIESPITQAMVKLAVDELANSENIRVSPINVISVATQLVNGFNYRIVFTAHPSSLSTVLLCTAKVFESFSGAQAVTSINCA